MPNLKYKRWIRDSSALRKRQVAKKGRTSISMLYHLASGYRRATSEMAARVEAAADGELDRGDISETCAKCPYFKACKNPQTTK